MDLHESWVVLRTFFSAGSYLFGQGITIYAMVQFCREYLKYKTLCHGSCPNFACGDLTYACLRAYDTFYVRNVGFFILVCAHTFNAFMFAFKFEKGEAPVKSAYFLPLMQFWRLVNLVKDTWSCSGVKDYQLEEKNTLFTQLALSLETLPMYDLQIFAWYYRLGSFLKGSVMYAGLRALPISTASSFLSSFLLGGLTVQATAKNAKSLEMKTVIGISSGIIISAAAYIRTSTLMTLYYNHGIKDRLKVYEGTGNGSKIYHFYVVNGILVCIKTATYLVLYLTFLSFKNLKKKSPVCARIVKAVTMAYISFWVGPLYPLVSEALEQDQLGTPQFRIKLVSTAVVNLILDCFPVPQIHHFLSQADTIVSVALYMSSIAAYVIIDNKCGRINSVSSETTESHEIDTEQRIDSSGTVPRTLDIVHKRTTVQVLGKLLSPT